MYFDPNSTRAPPAPPGPFVSVPIQSAQVLYDRIPDTVHWNLDRVCLEGVRHESNVYGYFNSALVSIFPVSQRFQVNPQYPLRPAVEEGREHVQKISIGSIGEIFAARNTPREKDMKFPDFLITKVNPRDWGNPRVNAPCVVIEIKTSDKDEWDITIGNKAIADSMQQLILYTDRVSKALFTMEEPNANIIPSFLTYGKYYSKVILTNGMYSFQPWLLISEQMALPDRAPLLYRLCEIAVGHWDSN
ncbi:hypothetical protein H0H87_001557 [Tephrocybe sp. NHM501043]|nr:hypothetical protein H0H87_001557 [Tephrocybe sp. NHM501043]